MPGSAGGAPPIPGCGRGVGRRGRPRPQGSVRGGRRRAARPLHPSGRVRAGQVRRSRLRFSLLPQPSVARRRDGGIPGASAGRVARQREGDGGPGSLLLQRGAASGPGDAGDPGRGGLPGGPEEGAAPRLSLQPWAASPAGRLAGIRRRPPGERQGGAGTRRRDPLVGLLARALGHGGAPVGFGLDRQDLLPGHQPGGPLHAPAQGGELAPPEGGGAGDDPAGAEGRARPPHRAVALDGTPLRVFCAGGEPGRRAWLGGDPGVEGRREPTAAGAFLAGSLRSGRTPWSAPTGQGFPGGLLPVTLWFAKGDTREGVKPLHTHPKLGFFYLCFSLSCPSPIPWLRGRRVVLLLQPPLLYVQVALVKHRAVSSFKGWCFFGFILCGLSTIQPGLETARVRTICGCSSCLSLAGKDC